MSVTFLHAALGRITQIRVSISRSIFEANPPVCILAGTTIGGPPSFYYWTKDGDTIRNSTSFGVDIGILGEDINTYQMSIYVSTLTVKGRFPGVYAYIVRNKRRVASGAAQIELTSMYIMALIMIT